MLESIYHVLTWACNRQCDHCYDDRFRPYPAEELGKMLEAQAKLMPRIIGHFPDQLMFRDLSDQKEDGTFAEKSGRIILAGGEVLLPDVRERLLYRCLKLLEDKYGRTAGIVIQTGGDFLDERVLDRLLETGVRMVSVSSIDMFQEAGRDRRREQLRDRLERLFEQAGMESGSACELADKSGPVYEFFGATPNAWIGKLWPSGRAWRNCLSTAKYADNFCNGWSGALGFLSLNSAGSEIAVDPGGNVYPCCRKTASAYGNLTDEPLADILESLVGNAPLEALTCGAPERMGISLGVSVEEFRRRCVARTPKGDFFVNPCIGCDGIHREFIADMLEQISRERIQKRNDRRR